MDKPTNGRCRVVLPNKMTVSAVSVSLSSILKQLERFDSRAKVTQFRIKSEGSGIYALHIGIGGGEKQDD